MSRTREEILRGRRLLKEKYQWLFDDVSSLLFRHDPIGINFETNVDEYEVEVGTILPRLRSCHSEDEVCRVVHEEFVRWFDTDIAGPREHYLKIATEVWALWQRFTSAESK
jgi:hypothetical protein